MSLEPPLINVPLTAGASMTPQTYALLKGYYDALVASQTTVAAQAVTIAALDARITALGG